VSIRTLQPLDWYADEKSTSYIILILIIPLKPRDNHGRIVKDVHNTAVPDGMWSPHNQWPSPPIPFYCA
jgi:hypothetical protein